MPLTVGTDAYDSLANVDAYHAARGNAEWALVTDDATREVFIRKATDWVDRTFDFNGDQTSGEQRLKFPRSFLEVNGFLLDPAVIPWQVAEATAIVADLYRLGIYDMEGIVTNDVAAISRTKVDVVEVAYDTKQRLLGQTVMSHVYQLLRPLTAGNKLGRA